MKAQHIILDTDLGEDVDDILALALALLGSELCVTTITTVSYDTEKRCHQVARLRSCIGRNCVCCDMRLPLHPGGQAEYQNAVQPTPYILNQYGAARDADKRTAEKKHHMMPVTLRSLASGH